MVDHWQLLTDDAQERTLFASLAATLALPATAAAPPNRLRHVLRLATPHGVYYLKTFTATQWQNRLRFLCTQPRDEIAGEHGLRHGPIMEQRREGGKREPRRRSVGGGRSRP